MQDNNAKLMLLITSFIVAIAATGLVGYYQEIRWLFITSTVISATQFIASVFVQPLKDEMIPWLASCLAIGYFLTGNIPDAACFGICLYVTTAFINMLIPVQLLLFVVPVGCIVAYFLGAENVFIATAVYCLTNFVVKHFRGKNPSFAMGWFLLCMTLGVALLILRDTDAYFSVKMLKGLLLGSAAYYIALALYVFYIVRIKKDKNIRF